MLQACPSFNYSRAAAIAIAGLFFFTSSLFAQSATLQWNANTESSLAGYIVEYGTQSGSPSNSVDVGNVTQRQFTSLQAGSTYYFRVLAYNTGGQRSAPSAQVSHAVPVTPSPVTLTSVSPASGSTAGGTVVTLTGSGFVAGPTVRIGAGTATSVSVLSSTQVRATTPPGSAGTVAVQITTNGQTVTLNGAFTYQASSQTPSLSDVSPSSGPTSGGTVITLTGSNFVSGATVRVGGSTAQNVTFVSATQVRATTPSGTAGAKSVQIINPNGQSASRANAFTYAAPAAAPTLTAINPTSGPMSGGVPMTISGSNFAAGATVTIGGAAATGVIVESTKVTAITPATTSGVKTVTVTNPGGQSASLSGYNVFTATDAPTFTSISPTSGSTAGGTLVTVRGTNFVSGSVIYVGTLRLTSLQYVSATELRGRTPAGAAGPASVAILNPNGKYAYRTNGFTYTSSSSLTQSTSAVEALTADEADADGDGLPTEWEQSFGLAADSAEGDSGAAGDPDRDGTPNAEEYEKGTHPRGLFRRYFAEGAAGPALETRFALANPAAAPATIIASFFDEAGDVTRVATSVAASSRGTIDARSIPSLNGRFSTELESDQPIAVDRLTFLGPEAGAHLETAVERPSTRWYLADGTTQQSFALQYVIQNPNDARAEVQVRYLLPGGAAPVTRAYGVDGHGRLVIDVNREDAALASTDVAAEIVSAALPIVVERVVTVPGSGGETGYAGAGAPAASTNWFLQGSTAEGAMLLLVVNPSADAASLRVTYQLADGQRVVKGYRVAAGGRSTIVVGEDDRRLARAAMGIYVEATTPVVAERATWWGSRSSVEDGSSGAGVVEAGSRWLVAEAEQGGARQASTSIVVSNTGAAATRVAVTLLGEGGALQSATFAIAAHGQLTLPVGEAFPAAQGRFSVLVEGIDPVTSAGLVVERSIHWRAGGREAGAAAAGARLP